MILQTIIIEYLNHFYLKENNAILWQYVLMYGKGISKVVIYLYLYNRLEGSGNYTGIHTAWQRTTCERSIGIEVKYDVRFVWLHLAWRHWGVQAWCHTH